MTVVNHFVQPGHALYKNFLPSHMKCARSKIYLSTRVPPFHPIEESELSPAFDAPTMIWSTGTKLDAERIAQYKVDYGVKETQARGKLAFEMKYDAAIWQKVKTEVNPITTTPTNTTNVNIAGMRVLFLLHKLVTQFFKTNQYPAFFDNDKSHVAPWCYEVSGGVGDAERTMEDGSKVKTAQAVDKDINFIIRTNLRIPYDTFRFSAMTDNDIPTGYTGLVFPFVSALSEPDYQVVPRVLQRYFLGCLGINPEIAGEEFNSIKTSWGNLCKTPWGFKLAHIFRCIEVMLESQSSGLIVGAPGAYEGIVILGGLYTIHIGDRIVVPGTRDQVINALSLTNAHLTSLNFILDKVYFPDATTKTNQKAMCVSRRSLNWVIRQHGVVEMARSDIIKKAYLLRFPGEPAYLTPSAFNISFIFDRLADPTISEGDLPLHPEAILANDRETRLLSVFGIECPSFMVPGGKLMSLKGNFAVEQRDKDKGTKETRDVHKVAVAMVSLKKAAQDLATVKETAKIQNPFGAQIGGTVSSNSTMRKFEKEGAQGILASLRKYVGVTEQDESGSKRKREDVDEGRERQKKQFAAFDF